MRFHLSATVLSLVLACAVAVQAAPPVDLELATEQGVQITAPREWLQLLAGIGIENVRIRSANSADKPLVENRGDANHPRFRVVGILGANNRLRLPGGMFDATDRQKLTSYFARLSADGPESMTAERGRFGLTEKQFEAAHAYLAQPIDFTTQNRPPQEPLERLQHKYSMPLALSPAAEEALRKTSPIRDEFRGFTAGTSLAIMLRNYGLALRPEKSRGDSVVLLIVPIGSVDDTWPIGWESKASPGETAPTLMESLNVEIEGYMLQEAVDAIAPRIKLPIYWDHAALAKYKIDPATIQVHVPRTRTFYKRILDRVLIQGRLAGQLRVDEAGTAFLWITK